MKLNPRCSTGVVWDDFDRFVEATRGKKTLHGTVGITYQTTEEESVDQEPGDDENLSSEEETCFTIEVTETIHETLHKKKRRRAYQSSSLDILPYHKKTLDFLFNESPERLKFKSTFASISN